MKSLTKPFAAALLASASFLAAQGAHATGVTAGTLIQNTATATYTTGSGGGSVQSNTVTVKVDELLDTAVASLSGSAVSVGSNPAVLPFSVTNTGNGPEAFNLFANPAIPGNAFDGTVQSIVIDNGNGIYESGVDVVLAPGASTPVLAPDQSLTVFVLVTPPAGAADGNTSQLRLTADAATGTGTPGTVFAAQGQGGGDAVVGSSGASANALGAMIASLGAVTLTKSFTIADPFGGSQPVPGAIVTYSLLAQVNGTGSVDSLHVTDSIPAGTSYVANSLKLEGTGLTDLADGDAGVGSSSGIDVSLGTVAGGGTKKLVNFNVRIN